MNPFELLTRKEVAPDPKDVAARYAYLMGELSGQKPEGLSPTQSVTWDQETKHWAEILATEQSQIGKVVIKTLACRTTDAMLAIVFTRTATNNVITSLIAMHHMWSELNSLETMTGSPTYQAFQACLGFAKVAGLGGIISQGELFDFARELEQAYSAAYAWRYEEFEPFQTDEAPFAQ